jgi:molecular chaperone GrpE (heat shock protein)
MSEAGPAVPLPKWPFYLADVVLCAIIAFVFYRLGPIEGTTDVVITVGCLLAAAWAAWLSITPWLTEHQTNAQLSESSNLKSSMEQLQSVEKVAELIRQSNSQWQNVQDAAGRTVSAAKEISDKMKTESEEFMRFLENAHNSERAGLRLEVEKLRRMEGDWIKVTVGILDHVFAITRAAERSGQANIIAQMQQFQTACRDVARRIGLAPFSPAIAEPFDPRAHQLPDAQYTPPAEAKVGDVLATGFTYQGQLLRRALVMLEGEDPREISEPSPGSTESAAAPEQTTAAEPAQRASADEGQEELPLV